MSSYYCRLCSSHCSFEDSSLFSNKIIEMIEYCIPEFDIKLINNPIICSRCNNLLKQTDAFKRRCLAVQESIRSQIPNNISNEVVDNSTSSLFSIDISATEKNTTTSPCNDNQNQFLATGIELKPSNNIDIENVELSETKVDTHEETAISVINDEFLNLLEGSPNINLNVNTRKLVTSRSEVLMNFYDDNIDSNLNNSSNEKPISKSTKETSKQVKPLKIINCPLDVLFEKLCCISCELRLSSLSNLIKHLYTVHQKVGDLYTCIICRYKSQEFKGIKRHYQAVHSDCIDLKGSCLFCFTNLNSYTLLHKHMRKSHSEYCLPNQFRCNSCDFVSRRYDIFRKHFFKSHDFICNYCCKSFESLEFLNRHIAGHFKNSKTKKDK